MNDAMDILGGAAIIKGEKNLLAHAYFAIPISITVEGANILTRNLMQFGQGLIKSHPYIYKQIQALNSKDVNAFDEAFFSHVQLVIQSFAKSLTYYFTRGYFISTKGEFKRYKQKLVWSSASFTLLSNIALGLLGPALKKRENISARFGDMLSYFYLITATLREYENNPNESNKPLVDYICNYGFNQMQIAREEILLNLPLLKPLLPFIKLNPIGVKAKDSLNATIVQNTKENLEELTTNIFISTNKEDRLSVIQEAVKQNNRTKESFDKIKEAIKENMLKKDSLENMITQGVKEGFISKNEAKELRVAHALKQEVISVDSYKIKAYKALR